MSNQSTFISQIQDEEKKAAKMLEKAEKENNQRVAKATEGSGDLIRQVEESSREEAKSKILKAKEEAKEGYKKIIVDGDNSRRDVVEGGKVNISKGQKHVKEAFMAMFQ